MKKFWLIVASIVLLTSLLIIVQGSALSNDSENPSKSYKHVDAEYENSNLSLWFDYASEKPQQTEIQSTDMESFCVYMAKNEIEDAQFLLCSTENMQGLTASLGGFTDSNGNTLDADIYIAMYANCDQYGYVPDAIPKLSDYGPFDLSANNSQVFLVKITSTSESVAGDYSSSLTIFDSTGKAIKTTTIFAHVWNFTLSDETACATSMCLDYSQCANQGAALGIQTETIYKNYYDYLLENRICSYYLPYDPYRSAAVAYMDNPRVTSFQMASISGTALSDKQIQSIYTRYFAGEENKHRFEKSYFFSGIVDANTSGQLEGLRQYNQTLLDKFSSYKPDYADVPFYLINTYFFDIDYQKPDGTIIDQIEYYSDFLNFWCCKPFAYTTQSELSIPGTKLMQPAKWNMIYGTFSERMAQKLEDGKKIWWFLSWDSEEPYINYRIQTDGVAQRILFWQQYQNGVQGFLYNFSNYWRVGGDPYEYNITDSKYPNGHGESILIYPGSRFDIATPVGSLRVEAMRDGIEDYQMFTMLDSLGGNSSSIISKMTTGVASYSTSDESYYYTRIALGNEVEKRELSKGCEHTYVVDDTNKATCENDGYLKYTCSSCGDSYTENQSALGHNIINGTCTNCGYTDHVITYGDVDENGKVNSADLNILTKYISGTATIGQTAIDAADVNGDGKVTSADSNYISKFISGSISEFPAEKQ